jgi:asparagine synthase (glutamine-hydrolysing)
MLASGGNPVIDAAETHTRPTALAAISLMPGQRWAILRWRLCARSGGKVSVFAGVLALETEALRPHLSAELEAAFAARGFRVSSYADPSLVLFHGSLDVLGEPDFLRSREAVCALAGDLCLPGRSPVASSLEAVAGPVIRRMYSLFAEANGTFAACVYQPKERVLTLISDCLGARPVYYVFANGCFYFSTSLEVIEQIPSIPKQLELAAVIEQEALCYPLGGRTLYCNIKVITDNTVLVVTVGAGVDRLKYFEWSRTELAAGETLQDLAEATRRAVRDAVAERAMPGATALCLLSGGLDSRVIAAELLDLGKRVETVTVAREGFQDTVYARRFAATAGVSIELVPWTPSLLGLTAGETTRNLLTAAVANKAPAAVFSGDGGGETLGFLLLNAESLALLGQGRVRAGAEKYLATYRPLRRVLKPHTHREVEKAATDRLEVEIRRLATHSLEKALHLSVLLNDLRCHLHAYFSNIVRSRVELLLPFYDRRVIASVVRIPPPLAPYLRHAFYHRVLDILPPVTAAVPWQTYPGHLPCPVADPHPPRTQWSASDPAAADGWARDCFHRALRADFPPFLRRSTTLAACVCHRTRVGDYGYAFRSILGFARPLALSSSWVTRYDSHDAGCHALRSGSPESSACP